MTSKGVEMSSVASVCVIRIDRGVDDGNDEWSVVLRTQIFI